ncbi:MAG: STAS domain-containing protein [Candidatus Sericytochromatia bacterium]|nr:STAS domain-containing protein [Candidatus Sericytochromatia bacterium]
MQIKIEKVKDLTIVNIMEKRLDAKQAISFREKILELVESGNKLIVLDFKEIDFIDSSGLGAIVSVLKMVGREGKLVLSGIKETVMSTFSRTKMDKVFIISKNIEEAIDKF